MTAPRAAARKQLATLLEAALVGTGKPAQTVYPYQVGDFKGATPVVAVTSGPMRRRLDSMGECWRKSFQLLVYVFVAYSDNAGWTEDLAEDAIDAIEDGIAAVILANPRTDAWVTIAHDDAGWTLRDHLDIAAELIEKGFLKPPLHAQFVLGVRGALAATRKNLEILIKRLGELPGPASSWGVAGVGRHQLTMADTAARLGGNLRVGLEDNIYIERGVLAKGSYELVERAVALCKEAGRSVATVSQARAALCG